MMTCTFWIGLILATMNAVDAGATQPRDATSCLQPRQSSTAVYHFETADPTSILLNPTHF